VPISQYVQIRLSALVIPCPIDSQPRERLAASFTVDVRAEVLEVVSMAAELAFSANTTDTTPDRQGRGRLP